MLPSRCVVFEDTPPGIEAALNAGMQTIGLLTTVPAERLRTTHAASACVALYRAPVSLWKACPTPGYTVIR